MVSKKHSISSKIWLKEHFNDQYVKKARKEKLRSRASFKLSEMQRSNHFLKPGMIVVDLGSSPGGWSKYAVTQIGNNGRIIACDRLPMYPIAGVNFLQGDLNNPLFVNTFLAFIGDKKVQVVMSDMAPNICGIPEVDVPNIINLVKIALKISNNILEFNGTFIVKTFYGEGFEEQLKKFRFLFQQVKVYKPISSRNRSREVYIIAIKYKK